MKYIFISFLILFFGYFGIFNPVRDLYLKIASPIQFGLKKSAINLKDTISFYSNVSGVHKENLQLKSSILELESRIANLKVLQDENTLLKQQLGLKSNSVTSSLVLAEVMGNPNDLTGDEKSLGTKAEANWAPSVELDIIILEEEIVEEEVDVENSWIEDVMISGLIE